MLVKAAKALLIPQRAEIHPETTKPKILPNPRTMYVPTTSASKYVI